MNCQFEKIEDFGARSDYRCVNCGLTLTLPTGRGETVISDCRSTPTTPEKAAAFVVAITRYVASGCADVTQEEFDKRGEICQACPIYDHANEACGKCGCTVGGKERLIDKRRMKSEKCPDGKW